MLFNALTWHLRSSVPESYIIHVRVTEDAACPSSCPPPDSPPENKKLRVIILAVRSSGLVRLHKARENPDSSFSIGKSWSLNDLSSIESFSVLKSGDEPRDERMQMAQNLGFIVTVIKPYFWQADTAREKEYFLTSLIKIYRKFTGGRIPTLIGFDAQEMQQVTNAPNTGLDRQPIIPAVAMPASLRPQMPPNHRPPHPPIQPGNHPPSIDTLQEAGAQPYGLGVQMQGTASSEDAGRRPDGRIAGSGPPPLRPVFAPGLDPTRYGRGSDDGRYQPGSKRGRPPGVNGVSEASGTLDRIPMARRPSAQQSDPLYSAAGGERTIQTRSAQGSPARPELSVPSSTVSDGLNDNQDASSQQSHSSVSALGVRADGAERLSSRERLYGKTSLDSVRSTDESRRPPPRPTTVSLSHEGTGRATPDTNETGSFTSERSERLNPPLTTSTAATTFTPHLTNSHPVDPAVPSPGPSPELNDKEPEETYRPGLGPMIKKKSNRDVAVTFRKAATAYNAFKPRGGVVMERPREVERRRGSKADGITCVVPAPSARGGATSSSQEEVRSSEKSLPPVQEPRASPPEEEEIPGRPEAVPARTSTTNISEDVPRKSNDVARVVGIPSRGGAPPSEPPIPEVVRPEDENFERTARMVSNLGIDPSRLQGRGGEMGQLLREFRWDGHDCRTKKVEALEVDLRREIGRVEAGSWLWHLDQGDQRVDAVSKLLDEVISECDQLDGLLSLYQAEMNV